MSRFLRCQLPRCKQHVAWHLFMVLVLSVWPASTWAGSQIDGVYLSEDAFYRDALQGKVPIAGSAGLELEFGIENGKMTYIRILAPRLNGIDRLYARVRGLGCIYTSLGYPIVYPGSVIKLKTGHGLFEVKYQSNGKNIFNDAFVVTNMNDGKTQTYEWQQEAGRIWFDAAPLKYDAATQTYAFSVSPKFLPENYANRFRQEGDIKWLNEISVTLNHGQGVGTLKLDCPKLSLGFKLKKQ